MARMIERSIHIVTKILRSFALLRPMRSERVFCFSWVHSELMGKGRSKTLIKMWIKCKTNCSRRRQGHSRHLIHIVHQNIMCFNVQRYFGFEEKSNVAYVFVLVISSPIWSKVIIIMKWNILFIINIIMSIINPSVQFFYTAQLPLFLSFKRRQ